MTCLELSRRKAEASVGEGPCCGLWRTLAALSAVPGGRRATSILALGAEGERARPSFCLAGRLVKPQSRAKGGGGDACSAASAPRAHRCCAGGGGCLSGFRASSATHLTNYLWNCCIHSHLNKNLSTRRLSFVAAGPLLFPAHPEDDGLEVMQIHYRFICWWLPRRQGT